MASTATPAVLKQPKAMQAACVALPADHLVPHGKDGFRVTKPLPVGTIVFGHGACIVSSDADYQKVQACRGTKRPAEEDASDADVDKEQAAAERKAKRLLKHLPGVVHALDNTAAPTAAGQLRQMACMLDARAAALAAAGNGALAARGAELAARVGAVAAAAEPKGTGAKSDPIEFELDEQAEIDRAAEVRVRNLERQQSMYWEQTRGLAAAGSDEEEEVQEAVQEASDAAVKRAVFDALGDEAYESEEQE